MNIQQLLAKYNFTTKKSLGQNFLTNEVVLDQIVDAGEITSQDTILEIGPGLGPLTEKLLNKAQKVIAIEKDSQLVKILNERFQTIENLQVIEGDALTVAPPQNDYKIIANIPYYITSPLINHFLKEQIIQNQTAPTTIVLLTQKEVAEKICDQKKRNVIGLNIQTFGEPEIITFVPASDFIPAPKVDSAVLKINIYPNPPVPIELYDHYFQLIHAGFKQKRKTLINSLRNNLRSVPGPKPIPQLDQSNIKALLEKADIKPGRRAETLSINEWKILALEFKSIQH